ncbi:response regulator [Pseudomonadota bacterium]
MADILIIDDDADIRQLVAIHLEGEGHTVRHAENGRGGIEEADKMRPDLIILDINMPVMDGTQVMKALRAADDTANVPVIALSAVAVPEMRDDMHALGCDAYVSKPIDFPVLLAHVTKLTGA